MAIGPDKREPPPVQASSQPGHVTVPGKPGDDLPPGTWNSIWNSILKQSGLEEQAER